VAAVNDGGQQPSSSVAAAGGNNSNHDYVSINDLLQNMTDNDGGGDGEQDDVLEPDDVELFQNLANRMKHDDNAYRKYVEDPECYDRRSEKKKKKYDTKLCVRREFPVCIKNHMCYYIVHAIFMS
jgi:hypothetical protein